MRIPYEDCHATGENKLEMMGAPLTYLESREVSCIGEVAVIAIHRRLWKDDYCVGCDDKRACDEIAKAKIVGEKVPRTCLGQWDRKRECQSCDLSADCQLIFEIGFLGESVRKKGRGMDGALVATVEEVEVPVESLKGDGPDTCVGVTHDEMMPLSMSKAAEGCGVVSTSIEKIDLTTAVTKKPEVSRGLKTYQFPQETADFKIEIVRMRALSDVDLIEEMAKQEDVARSAVAYSLLRAKWAAISIALNERQLIPPVRRAKLFASKSKKPSSLDEFNASNDRQLIDVHWLYCAKSDALESLSFDLSTGEFDFDLAAEFVRTKGTAGNKATMLGLCRKEMLLLSVIRTDSVKSRQYDIRNSSELRWMNIREAMSQSKCRQTCAATEMNATCHALLLADLDVEQAVQVLYQLNQIRIEKKTMRRRAKWLRDMKIIHPVAASV